MNYIDHNIRTGSPTYMERAPPKGNPVFELITKVALCALSCYGAIKLENPLLGVVTVILGMSILQDLFGDKTDGQPPRRDTYRAARDEAIKRSLELGGLRQHGQSGQRSNTSWSRREEDSVGARATERRNSSPSLESRSTSAPSVPPIRQDAVGGRRGMKESAFTTLSPSASRFGGDAVGGRVTGKAVSSAPPQTAPVSYQAAPLNRSDAVGERRAGPSPSSPQSVSKRLEDDAVGGRTAGRSVDSPPSERPDDGDAVGGRRARRRS